MNVRVPACLLALLAAADIAAGQSLSGLAQQEEQRRRAIQNPAKVITDKDLHPAPAPTTDIPTPASSAASAAAEPVAAVRLPVAAAQFRDGALPPIPVAAVAGGEVYLELTVTAEGRVSGIKTLRHTAPFTDLLAAAARSWVFRPAEDATVPAPGENIDPKTRRQVESKVLLIGLFRPPALYSMTLGDAPKDVAAPSEEIPFPVNAARMPLFPPLAVNDAVELTELRIGPDGRVVDAAIVRSVSGFDRATLESVEQLAFRPASVRGLPAARFVYAVTAFRRPTSPASGNQSSNTSRP